MERQNSERRLGDDLTLKIISGIVGMNETIAVPKELLEKIKKKMESVENRIKKLDRLKQTELRD